MKDEEYKKILFIENDAENRVFMEEVLSDGFRLTFAEDGDEGFRLARSDSPDLIVLDLTLPKLYLLRYFVENINRVLSRERILQAVWRGDVVTERTVDTHMTSLRKTIRNSSLRFSTLYGAGYILKSKEREPFQ